MADSRVPAATPYVMSPSEVVLGYVFGQVDVDGIGGAQGRRLTPRAALELAVRDGLKRPPFGVAFSGGRDSSAVLAVAAHVARRDGLPDPVPITRYFLNAPRADERHWQELVVRHLGLREWHRVEIADELDVVGPIAARHLRTYGVVWPPAIASDVPLLEAVPGGSLLDGEGGDQVLGVDHHRIAPLTSLVRSPRPFNRKRVARAMQVFAPATRRTRRRMMSMQRPWLRPAAAELLAETIEQLERERPLSYAKSLDRLVRRRDEVFADANRRILAAEAGVALSSPLLDRRFVGALARDGGRLGRGTRTSVLRHLVPDLLPTAVLTRTTKAVFNTGYIARHTRRFAMEWNGEGIDRELVDPDALRDAWLSEWPIPATAALAQTAWLAAGAPSSATDDAPAS